MSLAARIFGEKTETIENFRDLFASLFATLAAINGPVQAKTREYLDRGSDWTRQQIEAGYSVTSEQPAAVREAVTRIEREAAAERRALYASHERQLRAEIRRRYEGIVGRRAELAAEVGDMQDLERLHRQLATACGVEIPTPIAPSDDAFSESALLAWRARAERVLNPPKPQAQQRREPNVLVLD